MLSFKHVQPPYVVALGRNWVKGNKIYNPKHFDMYSTHGKLIQVSSILKQFTHLSPRSNASLRFFNKAIKKCVSSQQIYLS